MQRRKFLKTSALLSAGAAGACALPLLTTAKSRAAGAAIGSAKVRWGMVIDLGECRANCTACVEACRKENNVNFVGDSRRDVYRIRKTMVRSKLVPDAPEKPVPLLCNHCDNPPCALACPIKATFKREDGIVMVDPHRCMGCRYCVIACPYNARHFNYRETPDRPNPNQPKRSHGVAESCTLCAHRLDRGQKPACVEACERVGARALVVGDLNDPFSEVAALIRTHSVKRLREGLGTEPKVFYIGL
jgi:molybdopterin-containing oxidoreductase family iron-sulfur binding subunit